jgi:hypothetical protein
MKKNKYEYTVSWDGPLCRYKQDFETIEEARIALALHNGKDAKLTVKLNHDL